MSTPVVVFTNHTCNYRLVTFPFSAIQNVLPYVGASGYPTLYVYFLTKNKVKMQEYKGHWPEFEQQMFVVPPTELADAFSKFVQPIVEKMTKGERDFFSGNSEK
jgi:type I restriction enzyme S subunit